jgi:hypothetical protein
MTVPFGSMVSVMRCRSIRANGSLLGCVLGFVSGLVASAGLSICPAITIAAIKSIFNLFMDLIASNTPE